MEASEEASDISQRDAPMEDGASQSTRNSSGGFDVNKFQSLIGGIPNDFEAWASLVAHIEQTYPNDIERISMIYDAFLFEYPLCYGYWNKYASHKAQLCSLHEVEETYERAVQAVPYSVDIWVSYSSFGALTYEDPADIRSLYERGVSFVKKDYLCYQLWDKYIEFEYCFKQWIQLAHLYIRTLMFPSKQLQSYYERFKRLVDIWSEGMGCQNDLELQGENIPYSDGMIDIKDSEYAEILNLIKEFVDKKGILSKSAFRKYLCIGEQFYHRSRQLDEKISCFEANIRRSYFHVKPLDAGQLKNWHCYLDFVERQGDFDWTVKLYERCLIACANYPDFWIRYVEFVDAKGGREIANHALARALTVFLKRVPAFHIYSSMFKEKTGDVSGARALSLQHNIDLAYGFIEAVTREANMEKRTGNIGRAYVIYEKAIELAEESGHLDVVPKLYCNFAQFTFVASGSINAARAVFIKGIQQSPCKLILEGLIHFTAIHGGASEIPILDTIIASAIEPDSKVFQALSPQDREGICRSFLEFVDLHGNIHEIMKAWDRHRKAFPYIMREDGSFNKSGNRTDKATVLPCNGSFNNCIPALVQQIKQLPTKSFDDILPEVDATGSLHMEKSNSGLRGIEEHLNDDKIQEQDVEEHSRPRHVAEEQEHETTDVVQDTIVLLESSKIENIGEPLHSSDVNIEPPSIDNLSMNSPDSGTQQVTSKTSLSSELPEEVITPPSSIEVQNNRDVISAPEVHGPVPLDPKSSTSAQADLQNEESRIYQPPDSHAIVAQSKFQQKLNAQSQYDMKRDLTAIIASPKIISGRNGAPMNHGKRLSENAASSHCHTQISQPQQWPVHAQIQYSSSGTSSEILMDQSQPHRSQIWPGTQSQQTNQTQLLYQMAAAQAYQTANFAWAGQSMPNQSVVFVQPQPGSQPTSQAQTLGYQQPHLNNEQYGYPQSGQVITPDIWYYYQQQFYYLQQQQQQQLQQQQQQQQEQQLQNQLIHNVSDQPPQTSQIGEAQQPEKHSQWLSLQSQQLLIQLQKQQNQQSNQQEPQVHASTPEKNQNQPQQQQQASQLQQQSEQANQSQQEQLLYLQQQQQMYLHKQQQLYLQQMLQHHYFQQQQQQQAPQQQFQQQHQILQQHQQQLLLQQPQQLFQVQPMQLEQPQSVGESEVQPTNYIQGEESTSQKVDQLMRSSSSTPQRTPTKQ